MTQQSVHQALKAFAETLTANFGHAAVNPAQAEDQLKGPIQQLLAEVGRRLGREVVGRTEATVGSDVRPDVGVSADGLLVGHIELKAPGKGARPQGFTDAHDRGQWKKLKDHPNLVYTDGNEWALYRLGERTGAVVRADGDVRTDGATAYTEANALAVETLVRDFVDWEPLVPSSPRALAELLAPLTRLLREHVTATLDVEGSALSRLADEWREYFFPDADDAHFADAYAQTVTYALLLARVEGEQDLVHHAVQRLERRHGLLAQVLRWLADPAARQEVDVPLDLLERVIGAVQPEQLAGGTGSDLWLYFYEDFLAAYDARLRRQSGVYYTPAPVVQAQTTLVRELLRERFAKDLGFADDDVTVLDPAVGTGTYLIAAVQDGVEAVRERYGAGAIPQRATEMGQNLHGFELLVGPYAVAHLRLAQTIVGAGGELPSDGVHVYLTDTLTSPFRAPPGLAHAPLFHQKIAEENERALRVKADLPILVCIGNPPYFRQVIEQDEEDVERLGGWVRRDEEGNVGILRDFLRDTPGVHAKNLYNLYVYFWRWALWKVFENPPGRGIVSFISASSYLRGPGFAGMRRFMRELFDDLWILDLGGEGRGARRSENVFAIQTPVAIAVGVRYDEPQPGTPAHVRYARIDGTRQEKYAALQAISGFHSADWQGCFSGWTQPFLPESAGDYFSWPALTELFPWQHTGSQFKRTWPIAPDRTTLEKRWHALLAATPSDRRTLFRETRDRTIDRAFPPLIGDSNRLTPVVDLPADAPPPAAARYGYRSLDRQYCLPDNRLGDFLKKTLWSIFGAKQLYMTTILTDTLGDGPAATATALVPDLHHFSGRGGKDVIPLWRDAAGMNPNITSGLLQELKSKIGSPIAPDDFFAYCYAVLSAPAYTQRFAEELDVPGPRVPITCEPGLFRRAVELGRRLVWLHTYGERLVPAGSRVGELPQGLARALVPIPGAPEGYPVRHEYDESTLELRVGDGVFAPVASAVRGYGVSGLDVIGSWLDYRMKEGAGRRSSELDRIRPEIWPASFTEELLRLLWIIEWTVELGPALDETLDAIIAGPIVPAADLPVPSDEERRPPEAEPS